MAENEDKVIEKEEQMDGSSDEQKEQKGHIPYDRFKEVNDKNKQLLSDIELMKKEIEKVKEKEMKDKQKFKELYEDISPKYEEAQKKATAFDEYIKNEFSKEYGALSDEQKELFDELIESNDFNFKLSKVKTFKTKLDKKIDTSNLDSESKNDSGKTKVQKQIGNYTAEEILEKMRSTKDAEVIKKLREDFEKIRVGK